MASNLTRHAPTAAKVLLTLAFGAAGIAKLFGAAPMVATFETLGLGQWFRYITGLIEVGSAALLWVPGLQALAAGLLVCTMIGAVLAHLLVLGPSAVPALILGLIAAAVVYHHRAQLAR